MAYTPIQADRKNAYTPVSQKRQFEPIESFLAETKPISLETAKSTLAYRPIQPDDITLKSFIKETPKATLETLVDLGQFSMRAYAALGTILTRKPFTPEGTFQRELYGTDKEITASKIGREFRGGDSEKESKGIFKGVDPVIGLAAGVLDMIPGGRGFKQLLARTSDVSEVSKLLRSVNVAEDLLLPYAQKIAQTKDEKAIGSLLDEIVRTQKTTKQNKIINVSGGEIEKPAVDLLQEARKYKSAGLTPKARLVEQAKRPPFQYKQLEELAEKIKQKDLTEQKYENLRLELSLIEERIQEMPGKKLVRFISRREGRLLDPYISIERLNKMSASQRERAVAREKKLFKASESAFNRFYVDGDSRFDKSDDFDTINDAIEEYRATKTRLDETKELLRKAKADVSAVSKGERLMELAKSDRRMAYRSVKNAFDLTEAELAGIRKGRDIMAMTKPEFDQFIKRAEVLADEIQRTREARISLGSTIYEKQFIKEDNLRKAMDLPNISEMTEGQLRFFDETLQQFKQGDEFLSPRELELVDRTDLKGIRTIREAKEALAREAGVAFDEINNIKVGQLDAYRYDTALAERNPFYRTMVNGVNEAVLSAEMRYFKVENTLNLLIKAARQSRPRGLIERLIPTDKKIFEYLESPNKKKIAEGMTEAELKAARYIEALYKDARDYLTQFEILKRFRNDYITHIRRGFLEGVKEDGIVKAFKELFDQYKQDQIYFNILTETGEILPLEKFFKFSMRRSGKLVPTQNVARAVSSYFKTLEKKKALDSIVPKLDIYVNALTPKKLTPRGLEYNRTLERFFNEWINTKKGRVSSRFGVEPGGVIDWWLRSAKMFTSIIDLGINIPLYIAQPFGESYANFVNLGARKFALGAKRLLSKQGRSITENYENFIGRPIFDDLLRESNNVGDVLLQGIFLPYRKSTQLANKQFLLGSMTPEEFKTGQISAKRLAELKTEMGRWRAVENSKSIAGATSVGQTVTQYKTWAIPIMRTTIADIAKITKSAKEGKFATKEAQELVRAVIIPLAIVFSIRPFIDKDDKSFIGQIISKTYRDAMSSIGALDIQTFASTPRVVAFFNDLGKAISDIVRLETYKTKPGLKGVDKLKRTISPSIIRQVSGSLDDSRKSVEELPKLPSLGLPKLPKL